MIIRSYVKRKPVAYLEFGSGGVWPMVGSPGDIGEVHVT